ncbi:MAG TPA: M42 family peptidase, partial [Thermoleophilia bacterium]|nr:M42 family peptidase [Thermoleophilia bacterium]
MDELRDLLATFANAQGVSGYEDDIAGLLQEHLADLTDEVRTDTMGNVIGTRNGDGPKIMIAAHMDEIGLMVKYIDDNGFLRFVPLGGWIDQILLGQRVVVRGLEGNLYGVVGSKPPHIMEPDDRKKVIKLKDMFIDIGASSREEAEEFGVQIGSTITIDRDLRPLKGNLVTGKAFDDRAGVAMMVSAMRRLKDMEVRATVFAVG